MKSNTIWALITGLAVGFLIGQYTERGRSSGSDEPRPMAAASGNTKIPADWVTEKDFKGEEKMAGLTAAQRYLVLKVMNEKPCDCGCPHGNTAKCAKEDPNCPRAPQVLAGAVAAVKEGKTFDQIMAAVKKPGGDAPQPREEVTGPQKVELAAWTPVKGPKTAKVTIVAFSDFQCPFCSRVVPTLKEIEDKYGKDVRIAFRHQPLPFHNHAVEAAEAAMAANAQGKFWQMHDKLFANQQALDRPSLDKYAQELGLNMGKYKSAMDSHEFKKNIEADSKRGNEVGANGTPAFFINGISLSGAQPFASFQQVIDKEIKHADELLKAGTPADKLYDKILETLPKTAPRAPAAAAEPAAKVDIAVGNAPVKGPKNAPVTIVIFSDYQCPFCSRVEPTLKQLETDYAGKIKFAWKNQPLPFHDKAQLAAEAAHAAGDQGKFWEYHDKLFANQQALDRSSLEKYAEELGLNMGKFKAALDSGKFKDLIEKDKAEAQKAGASGTPTFFINGTRLVGAQPVDAFKKAVDEALAKK
jgi:protein-disulfide isomerase